jgi:hypothetical protein
MENTLVLFILKCYFNHFKITITDMTSFEIGEIHWCIYVRTIENKTFTIPYDWITAKKEIKSINRI